MNCIASHARPDLTGDFSQLRYITGELKDRDEELYKALAKHSSIAVPGKEGAFGSLMDGLAECEISERERRLALTASPDATGSYVYYEHFKPTRPESMDSSKPCETLDAAPSRADGLLATLHEAHNVLIEGHSKQNRKSLEKFEN